MTTMADSSDLTPDINGLKAAKDKSCPFCGQAFTSSSLGRHLDLYIKEKNPKPPDGIHDVDQIRRLRGTITRRHPRNSISGRREFSTPLGTPRGTTQPEMDQDSSKGTGIPRDGQYAVDAALSKYPFLPTWEVTGAMQSDMPSSVNKGWEAEDIKKRQGMQRSASRQAMQKVQLDAKQKLSDAMDTARAAELALRELLGSWRAAKQHVDNCSMPFDFDPLSLDFPALTLQCLKPPPTLFSSTQHPTSTSWAVQTPGQREFEALRAFFVDEFKRWKTSCTLATTTRTEELLHLVGRSTSHRTREAVSEAERLAGDLEKQVEEHLQSAYTVWQCLPEQRQQELWVLELARGVGRNHKEAVKMKKEHHLLKQENESLRQQVEQLNRRQQPKEFQLLQPATVPLDREVVAWAYEQGVKGGRGMGFDVEDKHEDISTLVTKSIERWKSVITSTRASTGGLAAQKPLNNSTSVPATNGIRHSPSGTTSSQAPTPQQPLHRQLPKRSSTTTSTGQVSEQTAASTTTATTGPPSIEEASDQDADAEMEDDDSFALLNPSPVKATLPSQQTSTLEVPRTRGLMPQPPQQQQAQNPRFMMPNGTTSPRATINLSRSMPNINMTLHGDSLGDMGMAMQGVRRDMFME